MIFHLQHTPKGQVFLDKHQHLTATSIQTIEADSWFEARLQVNELGFDKIDGYGWFIPGVRNERR